MKNLYILLTLCLAFFFGGVSMVNAQCTINFETDGDALFGDIMPNNGDIVNFDNPILDAGCFNVLDENLCTCPLTGGGGADDVCLTFEMEPIFDAYGGVTTPYDGGTGHQITHETTGIRGRLKTNTNASDLSPGDVLCYNIEVDFEPHLHQLAKDVCVNTTSINTAGEVWESTSIIFWDGADVPYGTAIYNGFYVDGDGPGGDHPGTVDACTDIPPINTTPYTLSGPGVWTADCTTNVVLGADSCNATAGSDCPDNNTDPNASTDAGLDPCAIVGGFTFRVCIEDVNTTATNVADNSGNDGDGTATTSNTQFTSTLNGFKASISCCPDTQPINGTAASVCTLGSEITDWKTALEATDGSGAVLTTAVAPSTTSIVYSSDCAIVEGEYTTTTFNALVIAAEPNGAYDGMPCGAPEVEMTCAYVICDKGEDAACPDVPRFVITNVGSIAMTYFPPATTPSLTLDDLDCNYTLTPGCPTDVINPTTFGPITPGVDPPAFNITVTTVNNCMATFPLDPPACPEIVCDAEGGSFDCCPAVLRRENTPSGTDKNK